MSRDDAMFYPGLLTGSQISNIMRSPVWPLAIDVFHRSESKLRIMAEKHSSSGSGEVTDVVMGLDNGAGLFRLGFQESNKKYVLWEYTTPRNYAKSGQTRIIESVNRRYLVKQLDKMGLRRGNKKRPGEMFNQRMTAGANYIKAALAGMLVDVNHALCNTAGINGYVRPLNLGADLQEVLLKIYGGIVQKTALDPVTQAALESNLNTIISRSKAHETVAQRAKDHSCGPKWIVKVSKDIVAGPYSVLVGAIEMEGVIDKTFMPSGFSTQYKEVVTPRLYKSFDAIPDEIRVPLFGRLGMVKTAAPAGYKDFDSSGWLRESTLNLHEDSGAVEWCGSDSFSQWLLVDY